MYKVFISQPMNGRSKEDIRQEREDLVQHARSLFGKDNFTIIDSYFDGTDLIVDNPMWDLGKAIQLLSTADAVIMAENWQSARGCRIEHLCAEEYCKEIYYAQS